MLPDDFEGIEEPRKTWCKERMSPLRQWVKAYGRDTLEAQLEATLERIAGLESLYNDQQPSLSRNKGLGMSKLESVRNEIFYFMTRYSRENNTRSYDLLGKIKEDITIYLQQSTKGSDNE